MATYCAKPTASSTLHPPAISLMNAVSSPDLFTINKIDERVIITKESSQYNPCNPCMQ